MTTRPLSGLAILVLALVVGSGCPVPIPIPVPVPGPALDAPGDPPVCDGGVATLGVTNSHGTCSVSVRVGESEGETIGPGSSADFVFLMAGTYDVVLSSVTCTPTPSSCRVTVLCGQDRSVTASGTGTTVSVDCAN